MSVQLLITSTEAREKMTYTKSDPDLIKDEHIRRAQWQYIRPVLGKDFYDEILSQKSSTFSAANQTLYDDYIKPAMQYYSLSVAAVNMHAKSSNSGFVDLGSSKPMTMAKDDFVKVADSLIDEMKSYIDDNESDYGLYAPLNNGRNSRTIFY